MFNFLYCVLLFIVCYFIPVHLAIAFSVLRFTSSGYMCAPFGVFTLFHGYVPLVVPLKTLPVLSSFITWFVTRVTRRVALVEQELLTLSEHQSSPPIFNEVRVTRSLVFCVVLCISLFVLLCFCVGNCAVCPSIYGF